MGITTGRSPIIMDAAGDDLSTVFQGRDANLPTPGIVKIKVTSFRFVAGDAGGQCILKSGANPSDTILWQSAMLNPGQVDESAFGEGYWIGGGYLDPSFPAGGRLYIHYE